MKTLKIRKALADVLQTLNRSQIQPQTPVPTKLSVTMDGENRHSVIKPHLRITGGSWHPFPGGKQLRGMESVIAWPKAAYSRQFKCNRNLLLTILESPRSRQQKSWCFRAHSASVAAVFHLDINSIYENGFPMISSLPQSSYYYPLKFLQIITYKRERTRSLQCSGVCQDSFDAVLVTSLMPTAASNYNIGKQ